MHFKKETIKTNYKEPKFWEPLVIIGCNWCPYWYGMVFYYTTLNKKSKKKKKKKVKKGDPQNLPWPFRRRPGSHTSLHVLGNFAMGSIHSPDGVIRVFVDLLLSTYIFIFFIQFFVCLILFNKRRLSCCTEKKR